MSEKEVKEEGFIMDVEKIKDIYFIDTDDTLFSDRVENSVVKGKLIINYEEQYASFEFESGDVLDFVPSVIKKEEDYITFEEEENYYIFSKAVTNMLKRR